MTDLTKVELVQHSMNTIRSYLDDILWIQHQIEDLKARSKELASESLEEYFNPEDEEGDDDKDADDKDAESTGINFLSMGRNHASLDVMPRYARRAYQ